MEGDSLYYGLNAVSNNMIMADRKQLKNPNGLILGTPGSGKSFSAKREMTNVFFTTTDDIIIADPEGEYFDENELMIMAMFEQDTAENTKKELEEVLPYVADDMAVRLLVEQMISKMENLPDEQFKNLELDLYRPDAPEEEKV